MSARAARRVSVFLTLFCAGAGLCLAAEGAKPALPAKNLLENASFEAGIDKWHLGLGGKTVARFAVDGADACDGQKSGVVTIGAVESWGAQLAQVAPALDAGKICTFAVMAKSAKGPVSLTLEIQRHGGRWDRVTKSLPQIVNSDAWKESSITFKVQQPYPEGWSLMIGCAQPNVEFRLDAARMYEGEHVAANQGAAVPAVASVAEAVKPSAAPAAPKPATARSTKPKNITPKPALDPAVKLFDTGSTSAAPLAGGAIEKKAGWKAVPEDTTDHAFAGDAVLTNGRLAVAFRRGGPGAEVYGWGQEGFTLRTVLAPAVESGNLKLASLAIVDNSLGNVVVEATFQAAGGAP